MGEPLSVKPADQIVVQSMLIVSIPAAAMILGGLIAGMCEPPKKFSFALQHFAGVTTPVFVDGATL
jgi:hypothetical protein